MLRKKENIDTGGLDVKLKIFRFDPENSRPPFFETFRVKAKKGMTVLDALFKIQEEQDPTLVFRYSCRGAVCGSCGMVINGKPNLACRIQLAGCPPPEILLEPLPNLEIVKDLIVDMQPFWDSYQKIEPWLHGAGGDQKENLVTEKNRAQIDQFVNCILCACCYAACPVVSRNEKYVGPAALAKLFRFVQDSRDQRDLKEALSLLDNNDGLWGCHTIFRCTRDCPKNVRPTDGIEGLRRSLVRTKLLGSGKRKD